jgi:hypothetical protein
MKIERVYRPYLTALEAGLRQLCVAKTPFSRSVAEAVLVRVVHDVVGCTGAHQPPKTGLAEFEKKLFGALESLQPSATNNTY